MMNHLSAPQVATLQALRRCIETILVDLIFQSIHNTLSSAGQRAIAKDLSQAAFHLIMNRKQVAKFLGVSVRTLDRWVSEDGLPSTFRRIQKNRRPQRIFLLADTLDWQLKRIDHFWEPRRRR